MPDSICSFPYINRIRDNVLDVSGSTIGALYQSLASHEVIIPIAAGRSSHSMNIALSQLLLCNPSKEIVLTQAPAFPWYSMDEAAPILEQRYKNKKILILLNSGSGESLGPKRYVTDLRHYFEKNKSWSDRFSVCAITSSPDSTVGKFAQEYGTLVELKDSAPQTRSTPSTSQKHFINFGYEETGIRSDKFELGSGMLLQLVTKSLFLKQNSATFSDLAKTEFETVGRIVDEATKSEFYDNAINRLEEKSWVFKATEGVGDYVVRMALAMINHVKFFMGDHVYLSHPPPPRAGDIQFSVSFYGNSPAVIGWAERFRKYRGIQFSVVSKGDSELAKKSDYKLVIPEEVKHGEPRQFYIRATFALSPLSVKLIERITERDLPLPPHILEYQHSLIQQD